MSLQSAAERADQLSRFATYFGDASIANEQVARYQAVTADDVSKLARERLGPDNRVLLLYVPAVESPTEADAPDASVAVTA
jgi:zinc protease